MMEDIVLLETMKAADKDHRVFKLQFEAGEFDMVIYDQKENSCEIFEIKHSSKQVPFQYRHLVDEDKCQRTERRFVPSMGAISCTAAKMRRWKMGSNTGM